MVSCAAALEQDSEEGQSFRAIARAESADPRQGIQNGFAESSSVIAAMITDLHSRRTGTAQEDQGSYTRPLGPAPARRLAR
jgi:hypothetical protein